jgi:hypothetical protein
MSALTSGTDGTFVPPTIKYFGGYLKLMAKLVPSRVYPKGNAHELLSQEETGELKTLVEGKHGDTIVPMSLDSSGNTMNYTERDLLYNILCELRKINVQLSMITDNEVAEGDVK